ncbi:MtrB/PioB family decaheme-associated outer membrane protein [Marinimicrobium sp. C6131]|uniref:MtrB/PioB family decaheme-associated outer membrane protein n=1 Tax=Marinimicrobium sp. C6131 TaxID=3022676 RepID=UPI00223E674E|nr:MtrB/PioB family decaheme-associated outer membrane protein [Marinimicrobium sp. C6131]UZJ46000.1 MtrB/PioB family decaheme-associated outer membrane protein [Marinimicrobium sp. C6131]
METVCLRHRPAHVWMTACLMVAMSLGSQDSRAQGYWPTADTAEWACRLCPEQSQRDGRVTAGVGHVSESSAKFGDYTGLDESGPFLLGELDVRTRNEEGTYAEAQAKSLGLDSGQMRFLYGEQGRYDIGFEYQQIPHFVAEQVQTPFLGVGTRVLTLSANWERASTTQGMSQLDQSLKEVFPRLERETYGLNAGAQSTDHWDYGVDVRRTEQQGIRLQGASFLNTAVELPVTIDRVTERMDARLSYREDHWYLQVAYHGSQFDNNADSVIWDNPFSPLAEGGERGRLAQAPGNDFHQLTLSGRWQPGRLLQTSGRLAVGRLRQDELFLPATINPRVGEVNQPALSLDGRVDTLNGQVRALMQPWSALSVVTELFYDDRDNRTPRSEFTPVRTDLAVAPTQFNRPYSFERAGSRLRADFKAGSETTVSAGLSRETMARSFQETEKTGTTDYWGEVRTALTQTLDVRLKGGQERRRFVEHYRPLEDLVPGENPLLRRYHLGERDRDQVRASVDYLPRDWMTLSFSLDYAKDDYFNTRIGLTEARDLSHSLDLSVRPKENLSIYAFATRQRIDSDQAGSDNFSTPDWTGHQRDRVDTFGVGIEREALLNGLDVGLDYGYSFGRGTIEMETRADPAPFSDLKTHLSRLELFARYQLSEPLSVGVSYGYERYRSADFLIDAVAPDTVANLLASGQQSPRYSVHVGQISLTYQFW